MKEREVCMNSQGTPKTLLKAIKNGITMAARAEKPMPEEIERHVADYLNQMLAVLSLEGHEAAVERMLELIDAKCNRAAQAQQKEAA